MAEINFKPKIDKIIEVILFLAHKRVELDVYKLVKLVYLADNEHLNTYGRPITFDTIVAMDNGPVASSTYDIFKRNKRIQLNGKPLDYADMPFEWAKKGQREYIVNPQREIRRDLFSKSDLKVLEDVVEAYADKSFGELYDLTHEHPAYQRAWNEKTAKAKRAKMRVEDMIEQSESKTSLVEELKTISKHV